MKDSVIIKLFWMRDERAITETDTKYGAYCYQVADNILCSREDSEECVSDTWFRAWNAMPPQKPEYLRLFLAKITRNLAFNRYRHGHTQKHGGGTIVMALEELGECVAANGSAAEAAELHALEQQINQFAHSLPKRDCDIFVRRYFYTEPVARIAQRYHLTENHVSVILSRTRKKLRTHLEQEGFLP